MVSKTRLNVWMIAKWYPNPDDPQLGVFIQKHAQAISRYNDVSILYIHADPLQNEKNKIIEVDESGLYELIVFYKGDTSIFRKVINPFRYFCSVKKGIKILTQKKRNPDLLHSYILTRTAMVSWWLSNKYKIPFIISEQWSGFLTAKYSGFSWLKKYIIRFLISRSAAVTCVSKVLAKKMNEHGLSNSNYQIIPNVIETPDIKVKQSFSDYVNVLLVADLVDDIKNISGVISMISGLPPGVKFRLNIIGRGRDEIMLKNLARQYNLLDKTIFFLGLKTNKEVYNYLQDSDFLIMNSRFETFSLICAEAMSCGKPVLATRCGGPEEFVTDKTGILFKPDDNEELKEKFLFMLDHYREYNALQISDYANQLFSSESTGEKFDNLYQSVVKAQ